jgi:hypothetical protein
LKGLNELSEEEKIKFRLQKVGQVGQVGKARYIFCRQARNFTEQEFKATKFTAPGSGHDLSSKSCKEDDLKIHSSKRNINHYKHGDRKYHCMTSQQKLYTKYRKRDSTKENLIFYKREIGDYLTDWLMSDVKKETHPLLRRKKSMKRLLGASSVTSVGVEENCEINEVCTGGFFDATGLPCLHKVEECRKRANRLHLLIFTSNDMTDMMLYLNALV